MKMISKRAFALGTVAQLSRVGVAWAQRTENLRLIVRYLRELQEANGIRAETHRM